MRAIAALSAAPAVLGSLLLTACNAAGGNGGAAGLGSPALGNPASGATVTAFEGVYELDDRTLNDASCDADGPTILDTTAERMFVLVGDEVFGQRTLMMVSCADEAACRGKVEAVRNRMSFSSQYGVTLSHEPTKGEFAGSTSSTGFQSDGKCTGRTWVDHLLTRTEERVRLESRAKALPDKPPDEEGFCVTKPSEDSVEAESAPCTSLEVFTGQRIAEL